MTNTTRLAGLMACIVSLTVAAPVTLGSLNTLGSISTLGALKKDEAANRAPAAKKPRPPTPGARPIVGEAARWNEEGIGKARSSHFEEAADAFRKAIDADEKQPVFWNNLGSVYLTMGKNSSAATAFRRAIKLEPNYALAHYNLGAALDASSDYEGAIESYARGLELDPGLNEPENNPAILNNTKLVEVHLLNYRKQAGSLGAPLTSIR